MKNSKKIRLDLFLAHQLAESREKAQAFILSGKVLVNETRVDKCGTFVSFNDTIRVIQSESSYVSRGGDKLEGAWKTFQFPIYGRTALDIGISTGGFTDFLLRHDVEFVFGIDVGYGQLAYSLRNHPKVFILERTNARSLTASIVKEKIKKHPEYTPFLDAISLVVMDVSFISVTKILPAVQKMVRADTDFIILIKPQFEAEKGEIGKGGIIKNPGLIQRILSKVRSDLESINLDIIRQCPSPIQGAKGNQEYFFWLKNTIRNP